MKVLRLQALQVDGIVASTKRIEVLWLDSLTYPISMKIYSQSPKAFQSYSNSIFGVMLALIERKFVLKTHYLLDNYNIMHQKKYTYKPKNLMHYAIII